VAVSFTDFIETVANEQCSLSAVIYELVCQAVSIDSIFSCLVLCNKSDCLRIDVL
jgi:hypothetical protein